MIISFTGPQNTGKSSLLNKMSTDPAFRTFSFVPEVTRLVKKKYDLNINEQGDHMTQICILNHHFENYLKYKDKNVVLDRCILDGYVYTKYMYIQGKVTHQVVDYASYLFNLLMDKVDIIFYPEHNIPIEDDGVRSINTDFRNIIISIFEETIKLSKIPVITLEGDIENRFNTIKKIINNG